MNITTTTSQATATTMMLNRMGHCRSRRRTSWMMLMLQVVYRMLEKMKMTVAIRIPVVLARYSATTLGAGSAADGGRMY